MSLFQCSRCGCIENTSCSRSSPILTYMRNNDYDNKDMRDVSTNTIQALKSYKDILGISHEDKFEPLCSECSPVWYTDKGDYGIGKSPVPNKWHGRFKRMFLPKGMFVTDWDGNLKHKDTGDKNIDKYILETEEIIKYENKT